MEFVVAKVQRRVDGLEGFEVDVDLALLAFGGDDFTTVDDKAIGWDLGVELETLLGGGNSRQDGKTVDARLDVGGSTLGKLVLAMAQLRVENARILQPTSSQRGKPGPWALHVVSRRRVGRRAGVTYG